MISRISGVPPTAHLQWQPRYATRVSRRIYHHINDIKVLGNKKPYIWTETEWVN